MKEIKKTTNPLRELSEVEINSVNGGFFGALLVVAIALISGGCATMPKRYDKDDIRNQ